MKKINLLIFAFLSFLIFISCEEEKQEEISTEQKLTGQDQKAWVLAKIDNGVELIESFPECISDDVYEFRSNGDYLIKNNGTVYYTNNDTLLISPPQCRDTVFSIITKSWEILDSGDIRVYSDSIVEIFKIIDLTEDSFTFDRQKNGNKIQREFYISE
jgi:hypothetical protein